MMKNVKLFIFTMAKKVVNIFIYAWKHPRQFFLSLAYVAILAAMTIIIFSFNPHDRSLFFFRTDHAPVTNWGGLIGANAAAILFYLFGIASYFILSFAYFCLYVALKQRSFIDEIDRLFAWSIFIPSLCALAAMHNFHLFASRGGGKIGSLIYVKLHHCADSPCTTVILWALVASSFVLIMRHYLITFATACYSSVLFLQKQRWLARFSQSAIHCMFTIITYPFIYLHQLFNGRRVAEYTRSIVHLENEPNAHEAAELEMAAQDQFWKSYLQASVNRSDQELSMGNTEKINEKKDETITNSAPTYNLPTLSPHLAEKSTHHDKQQHTDLERKAKLLEEKLSHFDIKGKIVGIKRGPVVTLFEYQPDIDSRISKITALEDDLALALQALSIRIIAPIPGTSVVGFEVANNDREPVYLAELMNSNLLQQSTATLPLILGKDTVGNQSIVDLAQMPHLLIAGSTGSGKSVALHSILMSLLCNRKPDELKLILIDPKRLEFAAYNDIAHLLLPIITQAKQAINALRWVVNEMENRYESMKNIGARNINDYNIARQTHTEYVSMPYIVVIIDELADLMMVGGRDIEDLLTRITQMARAAGIHVLVATQRPSVDVITGVIKVNFPSRISFRVTSKVDSRTILDCNGAEKLLGRGDMLFLDAAGSLIRRIHGAYVSDKEIADIVHQIREQQKASYCELNEQGLEAAHMISNADDLLYQEIVSFVREVDEISISLIQRRFRIGYNRSARIIETLEAQGIIAPADGGKMRKVLR